MKDTKQHILLTAFRLFLTKSYKEVTMREIVEKTKLSKGAFYHYFKSKEELFIEIINEYYFSLFQAEYDDLGKDSLYNFIHQFAEKVNSLIKEYKNILDFSNKSDLTNYYMLMFDALHHFPGFRDRIIVYHKKEEEVWENVIATARKKGEIKSTMSDIEIARIFICISDGLGIKKIFYGTVNTLMDDVVSLWDKFYNEIKK